MKILAIESSCDETAAAVIEDGKKILSNIVATQIEEHKKFGGVVPEIASRRHCENIVEVVDSALKEAGTDIDGVDAIAVTYAPGLIGALLVGVSFAKGLAMAAEKPLIPVHHIAGHIAANYLGSAESDEPLKPPYLCLVASGGHSHIIEVKDYTKFSVIGRTRDDAAGEAFDKAARVLGFPYPGGVHIDKAAQQGNADTYKLPHPKVNGSEYDFSFSGLKTAVINLAHNAEQKGEEIINNDLAAAFQKTISEILVGKTIAAAKAYGYKTVALAGGVSANSGIRSLLEKECKKNGIKLYMPPMFLCGDNAAMIGCQAYYDYLDGKRADMTLNAVATLSLEEI
ncbi:MAG: tRNA (adenosine(37)-N6)-threonylcarbamoyltransferase complex transferase subunit TsaD [Oscillospiraceae bacterium]|nr:tRNA (adenosine(37)-N6)-threonylcarbamoyltransferase complex transferase subunit TsaD [Oscillospiraceae bacterium]